MRACAPKAFAMAMFLSAASVCHGQAPGKIDLEAAEVASKLIGASVFASDGTEVGHVADVAFDEEGQIRRLRMTTGAFLGIGTRIVEIPAGAFTMVRGAVMLDMPVEAVTALPEPSERVDEK
jgi:sporulation protein YlmC with PRC-barrel domain